MIYKLIVFPVGLPGRRWKKYPREAVGLSTTILTCSPEKKYPGSARKLGSLALLHKGKHGYFIALFEGWYVYVWVGTPLKSHALCPFWYLHQKGVHIIHRRVPEPDGDCVIRGLKPWYQNHHPNGWLFLLHCWSGCFFWHFSSSNIANFKSYDSNRHKSTMEKRPADSLLGVTTSESLFC